LSNWTAWSSGQIHVLLKRVINHKKLFRLYREEKLTVRRRGGRN
jgi:putative transposase